MDPVSAIADKLAEHAILNWTKGDRWIRVDAPHSGGFAVELRWEGDEWTVYLGSGGWHQHFDEATEALNLVAWCYSGNARIREIYRGHVLQKSILEALEGESWNRISETGYFAPFWHKRSEVVFQNPNLLSAEQD